MARTQLRESLNELKAEIASAKSEGKTEQLNHLEAKLDHILKQMDHTEDASLKELFEGVEHSVSEFEASHPRITQLINQVSSLLSSIGI